MNKKCNLCPRACNIDRSKNIGYCKSSDEIKIARAALHFWEEPCISGTNGSGTVFFSGCNLRCVYCQNSEISGGENGKTVSVQRLAEIFKELQEVGAHNINLVTPTHYADKIIEAISLVKDEIYIPFVWNTSGYESVNTLKKLAGYIDIYLTDMKYYGSEIARKYSSSEDYFSVSLTALDEMLNQKGLPRFDSNGIMKSGVIVRHMVLPTHRKDSIRLLQELDRRFDKSRFILSLMSQFTPNGKLSAFPEINRRITTFEYNSVIDEALKLGFSNAYMQDKSSADKCFTPPFDLSGV